jgi:2'-5' RNA ligase
MAAALAASAEPVFRTVHKTACCVIPPVSLWPAIQALRERHDKSYLRWPPHINLAYPFVEPERIPEAVELLRASLGETMPFRLTLDKVSFFVHSKKSSTLWLGTEDETGLQEAQSRVQAAIPVCNDLRDKTPDACFHPHLSVGQFGAEGHVRRAASAVASGGADALDALRRGESTAVSDWVGESKLSWVVDRLFVLQRDGFADPFRVVATIPLGGGELGPEDEAPRYLPPPPSVEWAKCLQGRGNGQAILAARETAP